MRFRSTHFFAQWLVVAAFAVSAAAEAGVVRCTAPDGRITYQDSACPKGSRSDPVDEGVNEGITFADRKEIQRVRRERASERASERGGGGRVRVISSSERAARAASKAAPTNAGERRFISAGMSASDVRARIGAPDQIVRPSSSTAKPASKGSMQRWIYLPAADDPQTTTVLSVRGGVVTMVDRRVTR